MEASPRIMYLDGFSSVRGLTLSGTFLPAGLAHANLASLLSLHALDGNIDTLNMKLPTRRVFCKMQVLFLFWHSLRYVGFLSPALTLALGCHGSHCVGNEPVAL